MIFANLQFFFNDENNYFVNTFIFEHYLKYDTNRPKIL